MKCARCKNEDPSWFYKGSKGWYCRRCISFSRVLIEEEMKPIELEEIREGSEEYVLAYPLSEAQERIGRECAQYSKTSDILLCCCCGSGKTEMTVYTTAEALKMKQRICFAISRRQVVLELAQRLQEIFPEADVIAVCGGHTDRLQADLIVCTAHQLYRYFQVFDILILDEPDAFPFKGNPVLHAIADTSCKGHKIYLTATPDAVLRQRVLDKEMLCLTLNQRPHGHPLPVPAVRIGPTVYLFVSMILWILRHREHPRMIFVPTIAKANAMGRILKVLFHGYVCTSKTADRDEVIQKFRSEKAGLIVATTVLERGVTIPGVDVCVWEADSPVFDEASLIQMSGRVGRTFHKPDGDCLFLLKQKSLLAERCVRKLKEANRSCDA